MLIPLSGSDVLSHLAATHLSGIFKGIIPYYTAYIAIPFSSREFARSHVFLNLRHSSIVTGKNREKTKANGEPKWRQI